MRPLKGSKPYEFIIYYKRMKSITFLLIGLCVVVSMYLTFRRNITWHSGISLWTDSVQKLRLFNVNHNIIITPKVRPLVNLGIAYSRQKRYEEALSTFNQILQIAPYYHQARYFRAVALIKLQRYEEALRDLKDIEYLYKEVLPLYPQRRPYVEKYFNEKGLYENIALCYERLGLWKEAERYKALLREFEERDEER